MVLLKILEIPWIDIVVLESALGKVVGLRSGSFQLFYSAFSESFENSFL